MDWGQKVLTLRFNMLTSDKLAFVSKVYNQWKIWNFSAWNFSFLSSLCNKIETVYLQPYLPGLDNNLSKNNNKKAPWPIKFDKNFGFLYAWNNKSCCNWWTK